MRANGRAFTCLIIALVSMPAPVLAASGVIEEIVVTARQRAESLQDTPVTITAVSDETIERLALNNLDQISDIVPNLLVSYGSSGGSATVTLRGIGTGSSSAGFSSAVGLLIDDVHFERGRWVQGGMVDLQQVEVLKGPQALYYGKNNTSGLIILRTRDPVPGAETEANFKAGYEFDAGEYLVEGGVSASLSDTFAIRLAARRTEQTDGWITNNAGPLPGSADPNLGYAIPGNAGTENLPELKDDMVRFTAVWTPNEPPCGHPTNSSRPSSRAASPALKTTGSSITISSRDVSERAGGRYRCLASKPRSTTAKPTTHAPRATRRRN